MSDTPSTGDHWDSAHRRGEQALSWYEPAPTLSLRMIEAAASEGSAGARRTVDGSERSLLRSLDGTLPSADD